MSPVGEASRAWRLAALLAHVRAVLDDVMDEEGVPIDLARVEPVCGADAVLCAADLVLLGAMDVDEADTAVSEAFDAAERVLDDARSTLLSYRVQSGTHAAGYCDCGEHVGLTASGHLRECASCDLCSGCGHLHDDCDCERPDNNCDDLDEEDPHAP